MSLKSVKYLIVCVCGVLGFILLAILPSYKANIDMQRQIEKVQKEIAEQREIFPLFQQLLEQVKAESPSELPFPKKAKLPKSETGEISSFFQKLAESNHFEVVNITPDVISMTGGSGLVKLDTVIRGRFHDLRNLLLRMGEIPYVEHIESVNIYTVNDSKEVRLKFWIAQE